jgi:nitroreductase
MDILRFIKSRRSVRKFLDKPVELDKIAIVLEAARWAPSAGNCQPWRFVVVTDKKKTCKFDPVFRQPWVEKAPVVIVVLAVPAISQRRYGGGSNYYVMDCSAAIQNMLLMAHGLGLGAVWIGAFSKEAVREQLNIPGKYEVMALVPIGYYSTENSVKYDSIIFSNFERSWRRSLDKIAFAESLDVPWKIKPEEV